jgi:PDZ domain-containing protein
MDRPPTTEHPAPGAAVPEPPAPAPGDRPRTPRWQKVLIALVLVTLVVGIAGATVRLPYVIFSPGDATAADDYLRVRGARTYEHDGEIFLLTVRVSNQRPNVWRYLQANLDDDSRIVDEDQYYGRVPPKRAQRQSVQQMTESQVAAKQAALTRLGYDVTVTGTGARVETVLDDSPAAAAGLRAGDVITAIEGTPVRLREQVGQIVQAQPAGTTFAVTVRRDGGDREVRITSGTAPDGEIEGKPYLGIQAVTEDLRIDFPVRIAIDAGDVSGPSGGLAFALTIIDELTPGDLTGGTRIAVTGAIDGAGQVSEVGGVPQKAVAARNAGADLMIVPRAEVRDARSKAGDMEVVGVDTLDEALRALRRHGGAPFERIGA